MEWSNGVTEAISKSKTQKTPLLVLVEPPSSVTLRPVSSTTPESPKDLYARLASNSIHDRLLLNDDILRLMKESKMLCVRFDKNDKDYEAFSTFFKLDGNPPNLFLIAPDTGIVLFRKSGYVSPKTFATALCTACWTVSKTVLQLPTDLKSSTSNDIVSNKFSTSPTITPTKNTSSTTATTGSTGSRSMKIPGQSRLRARLPDGRQIEKRFDSFTKFHSARQWLLQETQSANIQICTVFPRRVFTLADDSKQLIELDLHPSSSLVVSLSSSTCTTMTPRFTTAEVDETQPQSSWRAARVYGIVSSFVRSFVNPMNTTTGTTATADNGGGSSSSSSSSMGTERALGHRSGGVRGDNNNNNGDDDDSNRQWLSNGNSTQFGWNPTDVDDERTNS